LELGAALNRSAVYSEIESSLNLTVYTSGVEYVGMPIIVPIEGGE
jgi:hypothetical protein